VAKRMRMNRVHTDALTEILDDLPDPLTGHPPGLPLASVPPVPDQEQRLARRGARPLLRQVPGRRGQSMPRCGEMEVAIPQIEDLHRAIAQALIRRPSSHFLLDYFEGPFMTVRPTLVAARHAASARIAH
jgi:hypothetical protein